MLCTGGRAKPKAKRKQLNIGLSLEQYEAVCIAAEEEDETVTAYCRDAILAQAMPEPEIPDVATLPAWYAPLPAVPHQGQYEACIARGPSKVISGCLADLLCTLFAVLFIWGERILNGPCQHRIRDGERFVNKKLYQNSRRWIAPGQKAIHCLRSEAVTELPQLRNSGDHFLLLCASDYVRWSEPAFCEVDLMIPATYGYAWISKPDDATRSPETQLHVLQEFGIREEHIFTREMTGSPMSRPSWNELMTPVQPNDTVVTVQRTFNLPGTRGINGRRRD